MKYYKILRSDMTHHGFVYKEGLNIDTEPFDETSICSGGLFFSDAENILSFVDYGNLIAEVEVPDGTKIVQVENKYKAHAIVLKNIKPICTVDTFKYFIKESINIHVKNDLAFRYAVENDNGVDIHAYNDWVLQLSAGNGHLEVVKYLIDNGADIHADDDLALQLAARNGYLEVVRYLIENGANIHADDDWAFKYGTPKVVAYLNSISDK